MEGKLYGLAAPKEFSIFRSLAIYASADGAWIPRASASDGQKPLYGFAAVQHMQLTGCQSKKFFENVKKSPFLTEGNSLIASLVIIT